MFINILICDIYVTYRLLPFSTVWHGSIADTVWPTLLWKNMEHAEHNHVGAVLSGTQFAAPLKSVSSDLMPNRTTGIAQETRWVPTVGTPDVVVLSSPNRT